MDKGGRRRRMIASEHHGKTLTSDREPSPNGFSSGRKISITGHGQWRILPRGERAARQPSG